jgi:TolA-binding protein
LNSTKGKKDIFDSASQPLAARDIFAGSNDLYKLLDEDAETPNIASQISKIRSAAIPAASNRRLSIIKMMIRICIGLVAVLLLVPISLYCTSVMLLPPRQHAEQAEQVIPPHTPPAVQMMSKPPTASGPSEEPASWKLAQTYYQKKDYTRASAVYSKLSSGLSLSDPAEAMWDACLTLKLALCAHKLNNAAACEIYFANSLQSPSPTITALANYYLAFIKNEQKNYLDARMRAYKALAMLETIDSKYSEALIADCYFLIAQALTAQALFSSNQTLDMPVAWPKMTFSEPLEQLDEAGLQDLLQSGAASLSSAKLGPQIQKRGSHSSAAKYLVKCAGASTEELFAKFTSASGQDIRWLCSYENVRSRPTMLYLCSASPQKFFETASGCVGLLAAFDANQVLIHDPSAAVSAAEHHSLLTAEAISALQRFILSYRSDNRIADAHFAVGLLQQSENRLPTAIGEFRQVANRFVRSDLAPYSLLNAAKIKINIQDHSGAREYLKELCAQYPDSPVMDNASILLAQTSMAVGDYEYAGQIFRKVCYLNVSEAHKLAGTLGAAKCYFALKDYASAADWFIRYVVPAKKAPENGADLRTAYCMLAQANIQLGKFDEACRSYKSALMLASIPDDKYEITLSLVNTLVRQENLVEALDAAEKIDISQLSDLQIARIWLMKAQILHSMNLVEQAASLLEGRISDVQDSRLRSEMSLQLAHSQIALQNFEAARDTLCQALLRSEPGLLTAQLQCELADVCVRLGDNAQAVSICSQILNSSIPDDLRKRTRRILGSAYANQKQYEKAAKVFSGTANAIGAKQL